MNRSQAPLRRKAAGRPARLSREIILNAALELLDEVGFDNFSITKLARRLGGSVMSLYTYFPSRDALLDAVAERIFTHFKAPQPQEEWQRFVMAWLRALHSHLERYPIALKVIVWDEHLSTGWLRVWLPVLRVLQAEGLSGDRLGFAASWLSHAAIGFIHARISAPARVLPIADELMRELPSTDRALCGWFSRQHGSAHKEAVLEYGFRNIIAGLERLLSETR